LRYRAIRRDAQRPDRASKIIARGGGKIADFADFDTRSGFF